MALPPQPTEITPDLEAQDATAPGMEAVPQEPGLPPVTVPPAGGAEVPPTVGPELDAPLPPVEEAFAPPAAAEPPQLAGIGEFLGRLIQRGKGVKAPPSFEAAREAERVQRLSRFTSRFLEDSITVGEKTIKLDFSPLRTDERQVDLLINAVAEEYRDIMLKAKRGVISDVQLKKLADQVGMDETQVSELVRGTALNAERILAANRVLGEVTLRVLRTRDEIKLAGMIDDPDAQRFMAQQLAVMLDVESRTRGASSELGRAMRALQIPVEGTPEARKIAAFMRQVQDPTGKGFRRMMKMLDEVESPAQMSQLGRFLNVAPNAFVEAWINMLLSGPATHVANISGNFAATANGIVERLAAGAFGAARRGLTGADNGVYMDEAVEMLIASVGAFSDSLRAAKKMWKTGESTFGAGKFDLTMGRAISSENFGASGVIGWGVDAVGSAVNLPLRGLMTEDEFFKVWNFQMDLRARALRQAKSQGLRGTAARDEMGRIMADPETFASVFEGAQDYAKYVTFQRELGAFGSAMRKASEAYPPITKMILPFTTAPANLGHYTFERTPFLNMLSKQLWSEVLGKKGAAARDLAMAKIGVGAAASAVVAGWTFTGYITGRGPLDPNVRRTLEEAGWQPYSLWDPISRRYVKYDRTDPLGMFLGGVADATQILSQLPRHEAETVAAGLTVAFSGVLLNKTYLRGFAGVVEALEASQRGDVEGGGVQRALGSYAGTVIPSALAQVARHNDPVMRDVRTWLDSIYARVPGWSKDLPAIRDLYGRPRLREGLTGWAPDLVLPFQTRAPEEEPALRTIVENGIQIHPMSRTVVGPRAEELTIDPVKASKQHGVTLTAKEYDRWGEILLNLKVGGKTLKEALDTMVQAPAFERLSEGPDGGKALRLKSKVLAYRQRALNQLMRENDGEILKRMKDYYREKGDRLRTPREAEDGSSVDSGEASPPPAGADISAGIRRLVAP